MRREKACSGTVVPKESSAGSPLVLVKLRNTEYKLYNTKIHQKIEIEEPWTGTS